MPEHISQTSPLPGDEEGGSSHLLQSEISRNCSEVDFCPRTWKQCVFLRRNCFFICSSLPHSALMLAQRKCICGKVTEQNLIGACKIDFRLFKDHTSFGIISERAHLIRLNSHHTNIIGKETPMRLRQTREAFGACGGCHERESGQEKVMRHQLVQSTDVGAEPT